MIGVFDSGLGGLAALAPLQGLLPTKDIYYLADTAALPLGEKSDAVIRARIHAALTFFEEKGAEAVLLACGTAGSLITRECKEEFTFPIFDIIQPTAEALKSSGCGARVAVLCTEAAARAGAFAAALARRDAPVFSLACPALVRIAEGDIIGRKRAVTRTLAPLFSVRPTAIVLGCTHFSLLQPVIAAHFPSAYILDAAACAASATAAYVMAHAAKEEAGRTLFFTTGAPAPFSGKASRILGYSTHAEHLPFPIPM